MGQLLPGKITDRSGDDALTVIGVVQIDQRSASAGMAHACHQLAQARAGCRGQDVAGVAQVVEMDIRQPRFGERGQPDAAAEGGADGTQIVLFDVPATAVQGFPARPAPAPDSAGCSDRLRAVVWLWRGG
jgi:hypothetical protein